jgi:hypothetical protein
MMKMHDEASNHEAVVPPADTEPSEAPAWEMIEPGRYRPRRIRGSYRGRELG